MKRSTLAALAAAVAVLALTFLLLTQFFTGGRNPAAPLLFALLFLLGSGAQLAIQLAVRHSLLRYLPLVLSALWALWAFWLCCTAPHWADAAWGDVLASYGAPLLGCLAAVLACRAKENKA